MLYMLFNWVEKKYFVYYFTLCKTWKYYAIYENFPANYSIYYISRKYRQVSVNTSFILQFIRKLKAIFVTAFLWIEPQYNHCYFFLCFIIFLFIDLYSVELITRKHHLFIKSMFSGILRIVSIINKFCEFL